MSIATCDHNLGFLGMVLQAAYCDIFKSINPCAPSTNPGPAPVNAIGASFQITEVVRIYKSDKEIFTTYCDFRIILNLHYH